MVSIRFVIERAGVLDLLLADLAPARIDGGVVRVGGPAVDHVARAELRPELRLLADSLGVRALPRVEVVEVAEELVEAVDGRQELIPVAQVVLAELAGGIALRFEQRRQWSASSVWNADRRARQADRGHARCGSGSWPVMKAARPAVQLGSRVVVGEQHAFLGERSIFGVR